MDSSLTDRTVSRSVGDLNEAEVDAYLDFCENALLGRNYQGEAHYWSSDQLLN